MSLIACFFIWFPTVLPLPVNPRGPVNIEFRTHYPNLRQ